MKFPWKGPLTYVMWLKKMKVPKEAEFIEVNGERFRRVKERNPTLALTKTQKARKTAA